MQPTSFNCLSSAQVELLSSHIASKHANNSWLQTFTTAKPTENRSGFLASAFPYTLNSSTNAKGVLSKIEMTPKANKTVENDADENTPPHSPNYILTIPCCASGDFQLRKLLQKIRDQSFTTTAEESRTHQNRLAVVVGINSMRSLDAEKNRVFARAIKQIEPLDGLRFKAIGKLWNPKWVRTDKYGEATLLWEQEKSFLILKLLRPDLAELMLSELESGQLVRNQVPFIELREWVKNSSHTLDFAKDFFEIRNQTPVYVAIMDADIVALRVKDGEGLFTIYDTLVKEFRKTHDVTPQLMSTGYQVQHNSNALLRLGVHIDMRIREAMSKITGFELAPYFPEPNTLFLIDKPEDLRKWKFTDRGKSLESLRLIQNANIDKILDHRRVIFTEKEALITRTPDRMKFEAHKKIGRFTPENIGLLQTLKSLRGIPQSHLFPKNWADRLYPWLEIKAPRVTNVTKPLMDLLGIFDVQTFSVSFSSALHGGNYSSKHFWMRITLLKEYSAILEQFCLKEIDRKRAFAALIKLVKNQKTPAKLDTNALSDFFEAKLNISEKALSALENQKLNPSSIQKCVRCACVTGKTVANELESAARKLEF